MEVEAQPHHRAGRSEAELAPPRCSRQGGGGGGGHDGSHLFENSDTGERFDIQENGCFYLPGRIVHEAWVPAGSRAIMILEDGWKVNWLDGPPPPAPRRSRTLAKARRRGNA